MSDTCPVCGGCVDGQDAVCSACGFKLIGATQSFSPVSADDSDPSASEGAKPLIARLRVVRGPQPEVVFELEDREMSIGRNPQCDIFLNDMTVSRSHARIAPGALGYEVKDANSFNGLWVNNRSVDAATLRPGDMLQVGAFCLAYEEE